MLVMGKLRFEKAVTIRTTAKAQRAINRVVASLTASDVAKWDGGEATKEAVINASWLWLDELPEAEMEATIARYLAKLQAVMRGDDAPADPPAPPKPAPRVTVYEDNPAPASRRRKAGG